jgi:hypothetical protein
VRASVQTGVSFNLARKGDPVGLTAEVGGFARPGHGLPAVVAVRAFTARGRFQKIVELIHLTSHTTSAPAQSLLRIYLAATSSLLW